MRRTKIIATIGPKTEDKETIRKLALAGTDIIRLNMSHGDHEWHQSIIDKVKEIRKELEIPLPIMIDTTGPEIRTDSEGKEQGLEEGDIFKIGVCSACDIQETEKHTHIDYQEIVQSVKEHDIILIDDGLIALDIIKVEPHQLICKVLNRGKLGDKKTLNLPGIKVNLPAITEKDKKDLDLAIKNHVEFIAQSFVRKKEDILEIKKYLKKSKKKIDIIAKIEDEEGLKNIDEIICLAEGIMVARGDLGVEIPLEEIPTVQRRLIRKCREAGKPVIVATHLLESMVTNARPTRAEVTDVANAVFQRADCVMLSSETTKGDYPIEAVKTLDKIARNAQSKFVSVIKYEDDNKEIKYIKDVLTKGACINAESLNAKAILVFTYTGKLVRLVTKHRPNTNIYSFTQDDNCRRRLVINWGCTPFCIKFNKDLELTIKESIDILKNKGLLQRDDLILIVSDVRPSEDVDVMEVRKIN